MSPISNTPRDRGLDLISDCQIHKLINYTDNKAFDGFSENLTSRKIFRFYFGIPADKSVCERETSSSQGRGQGLVYIRKTCSLVNFQLQHSKN